MERWIAACKWDRKQRRRRYHDGMCELPIVIDDEMVTCRLYDNIGSVGSVLLVSERFGQRQYDWPLTDRELSIFRNHYLRTNDGLL